MASRSPDSLDEVAELRKLVAAHSKLKAETLHLAVYLPGKRNDPLLRLFEVVGGFGSGVIDEDKRFFEIGFGPSAGLRLPPGRKELRLTLTSPEELRVALKESWPSLAALRAAKRRDAFVLLHEDPVGRTLWSKIK